MSPKSCPETADFGVGSTNSGGDRPHLAGTRTKLDRPRPMSAESAPLGATSTNVGADSTEFWSTSTNPGQICHGFDQLGWMRMAAHALCGPRSGLAQPGTTPLLAPAGEESDAAWPLTPEMGVES